MNAGSTALSRHAQERLQQRAIPLIIVDLLERFGSSMACGDGVERLFFDKAAIRRVRSHLGGDRGLKLIERWLGIYAVLGHDGHVVTVAHQSRRFRRP